MWFIVFIIHFRSVIKKKKKKKKSHTFGRYFTEHMESSKSYVVHFLFLFIDRIYLLLLFFFFDNNRNYLLYLYVVGISNIIIFIAFYASQAATT